MSHEHSSGGRGGSGPSNRAALLAVVVAFVVGGVSTLALRPPSRVSTEASAQSASATPLRWRVPTSFPTNQPGLGDNLLFVSERLFEASAGRMRLDVLEPGEVVSALGVAEAVSAGKIEAGYTWVGFEEGRIPSSVLFGSVPFGMEPWEYTAWWYHGGGRELGRRIFAEHDVHLLLCAIVGPETAGWFRDEVNDASDLEGLKIRFAGLGGKVLQRLGASVTVLAAGEIFQALDRGAIDATEYSLPSSDTLLGFDRIVSHNYFPGWHQPSTAAHLVIHRTSWDSLPRADQAMLENACGSGVSNSLARAEAAQGPVLREYPGRGVKAESLPLPLLEDLERVTHELLDDEASEDALFAEVLEAQRAFRAVYAGWKTMGYLPRDF